jgi:hypothetical protein
VSPVKYELGFYIPEDGILHSHSRGYLKCCIIYRVAHEKLTGASAGPHAECSLSRFELNPDWNNSVPDFTRTLVDRES